MPDLSTREHPIHHQCYVTCPSMDPRPSYLYYYQRSVNMDMLPSFDVEQFRLPKRDRATPQKPERPPRRQLQGEFLKGPVPMDWLCRAAQLPGKAFQVAVAIRFQEGVKRSRTVTTPSKTLTKMGITRQSAYRALKALEASGLVSVERHPGRSPLVTIQATKE